MGKVVLGIALILLTLWVGAFAFSVIPWSNWMHFPAFATACMIFVGGVLSLCSGAADISSKKGY